MNTNVEYNFKTSQVYRRKSCAKQSQSDAEFDAETNKSKLKLFFS